MTDLQSLHRALSEAESGSRELDGLLAALDGWEWHGDGGPEGHDTAAGHWVQPDAEGHGTFNGALCACRDISEEWGNNLPAPAYSTSLDAITSLIEKKLPGWGVQSGMYPAAAIAEGRLHLESSQGVLVHRHQVYAPTEPLARAIALVSALIAQESEK